MARYFRVPFADSGDKTTLPDETSTSIISYATGYSQDYQRNPATDPLARRPERNFFNQLIFDITDTLKNLYETGTVPFITSAMNNGSPFSYPIGARVILSNRIYENTTANNTGTPPAAGWLLVDVGALDARFLNENNNLSDLPSFSTARTNLSVSSTSEADARYLLEANNLSDLTNAATARTNLSVSSTSEADARYLLEANNLSDLTNAATARTNLSVSSTSEADARYITPSEFGLGGFSSNITDLNLPADSAQTQFNVYTSASLNIPRAGTGTVITVTRSTTSSSVRKFQISFDSTRAFFRTLTGTTWNNWLSLSVDDRNLAELTNTATARTNLGLGTAAVLDEGVDPGDLMGVGAFGLGDLSPNLTDLNLPLSDRATRFNSYTGPAANAPTTASGLVLTVVRGLSPSSSPAKAQVALDNSNTMYFRTLVANVWQEWRRVTSSAV